MYDMEGASFILHYFGIVAQSVVPLIAQRFANDYNVFNLFIFKVMECQR